MSDEAIAIGTPPGTSRAPTVLVVDDTEGNRYAACYQLRSAGINVLEAATGAEALAQLARKPDLIVLDINLPDMSGRDILRRIRSDQEISWTPVMHLSATFTSSEFHALGLDSGADAYLTHPLDAPVFLATARSLLRLSQAEAKVRRAAKEWRAAFDSLGDAIFIIGRSGANGSMRIQRCNRAASELMGAEPRDVIATPWGEALAILGVPTDAPFARACGAQAEKFGPADVEIGGRWYSASVEVNAGEQELGDFYVCVLRDITDRKSVEREVEALAARAEEARYEAEAANRAKSDFLAVMSHELRTPLNAIGGYVDLISMGIRGPLTAEQTADLARIKRSQASLMILINDVLNFAKIESGALKYDIRKFRLADALDKASEIVEPQIATRGLMFVRAYPDGDVLVQADGDKVQQIILNLLSNAIKFTPPAGRITVAARRILQVVCIDVSDTGMGIPASMIDAVFEPFVQVQSSRAREHGGVGLGLAISRDLARGMGGELVVLESSSAGTTFRLTLPEG